MQKRVNIATAEKPFFIDPASVTAVHIYPEKTELALYSKEGQMLWTNYTRDGIDPDQLMKTLAEAGNPLVSFPVTHSNETDPYYVSPRAVTYMTVSQPGKKDGKLGVILGVEGEGRVESYGNTQAEVDALLAGMKAAGKNLMAFTPDEAAARWSQPAALYIDPASVNEIRADLVQVNLYFNNSWSLDVKTSRYDARNDREQEVLDQLWDDGKGKFKTPNDAWREARKQVEKEEADARADFAAKVAAANGTLTKIENSTHATYIHPENYAYITTHDSERKDEQPDFKYMMILQKPRTQNRDMSDQLQVYFNSAARRDESLQKLTGEAAPAKPAASKSPRP